MTAAPRLKPIGPQPGPQMAFAESPADIVIYGGAAGGGKTWALAYDPLRWAHVAGFRGVIFRRTYPELDGILDEARDLYALRGGKLRESPNPDARFPSGARILFRSMQHEKDRKGYQGAQFAFIGFDELTHFTEKQFWYLISRLRSVSGVTPYARGTCNPDPDSFVKGLIRWWLDEEGRYPDPAKSGVIRWLARIDERPVWAATREELLERHPSAHPLSFTFIPSSVEDNRKLLEVDPGYLGKLEAQNAVDRARLRRGDWKVREVAGMLFRREWFQIVDELPSSPIVTVRFWDKAATEPSQTNRDPDWTRGAKVSLLSDGRICIEHINGVRVTPGRVNDQIMTIAAEDGRACIVGLWQDPGQAGKADIEATKFRVEGEGFAFESVRAALNKLGYAKVWSAKAERGEVLIKHGAWVTEFLDEAEGFPEASHDDMIDAVSGAVQLLTAPDVVAYAATLALHRKKAKR